MFSNRRSFGLLAAVALMASCAVAVVDSFASVVSRTVRSAAAWLGGQAVKILFGPEPVEAKQPTASLRGFVVHREHQRRQVKRQAPRIEDTWRMCPSV